MKKSLLAVCLFCFVTAFSQTSSVVQQLDSFFTASYKEGKLNGNVLVADKGNIIYSKSFGKRDWQQNLDLNEGSVFELASVSKQFTAMGIMILVKEGKLRYDDSLRKFFPQLPYHNITVRQLLNHTSGLPDYMVLFEDNWDKTQIATNDDMIALLAKHKPKMVFEPGTKWEYSNTGYALLASIIAKASGTSYSQYLEQAIFHPLQMSNTFIYNRRYQPKQVDNYAYGYLFHAASSKYILPDSLPETASMVYSLDGIQGDGCVNSTLSDLFKWDRALYTDKLVSKEAMQEALSASLLPDGKSTGYGFGWIINSTEPYGKIVSHSGGWPGYSTYLERHIDNDKTVIVLQNNGKRLVPIENIRKILYGIKPEMLTEVSTTAAERKELAGDYEIAPAFILTVTEKNDKLFIHATGQPAVELFKLKDDLYFTKAVEAKLRIIRDADKKITSVVLLQNGREIPGIRK